MSKSKYTCNEYRQEMILLSLQKRINEENISEEEKVIILKEIKRVEHEMEMD
jgi:hypothetical protein